MIAETHTKILFRRNANMDWIEESERHFDELMVQGRELIKKLKASQKLSEEAERKVSEL